MPTLSTRPYDVLKEAGASEESIMEVQARANGIKRHQELEKELLFSDKEKSSYHARAARLLSVNDISKYYRHVQHTRIQAHYSHS